MVTCVEIRKAFYITYQVTTGTSGGWTRKPRFLVNVFGCLIKKRMDSLNFDMFFLGSMFLRLCRFVL